MFDHLLRDLARSLEHNWPTRRPGVFWPPWVRLLRLPLQFGTQAIIVHRFGRWAAGLPVPGVRHLLLAVYAVAKYLVQIASKVTIAHHTEIGRGLVVHTWGGVFLGPDRIGENCYVESGVVISYAVKEIGDNVYFGPGAKVHGDIRIGSNVRIGANAVVAQNIPDNCTVMGNPPRIISSKVISTITPHVRRNTPRPGAGGLRWLCGTLWHFLRTGSVVYPR